jgi:hypothetical protein
MSAESVRVLIKINAGSSRDQTTFGAMSFEEG